MFGANYPGAAYPAQGPGFVRALAAAFLRWTHSALGWAQHRPETIAAPTVTTETLTSATITTETLDPLE
jgi:hypothetical protein